jgi:alkylation response protein AidB-like acyl-CoA dehydrogenase
MALPIVREGVRARAATVDGLYRGWAGRGDLALSTIDDLLIRACEDAIDVVSSALLAHGGYGYLAEYRIESLLRDLVSLRAAVDTAGIAEHRRDDQSAAGARA